MVKKTLVIASALILIAAVSIFMILRPAHPLPAPSEPAVEWSILFQGKQAEALAFEKLLNNFAAEHSAFSFRLELIYDETPMPTTQDFQMAVGSLDSLKALSKRLRPIDGVQGKLPDNAMMHESKLIGLPLYEHRFVSLFYDKRKVEGGFSTWLDLASKLQPESQILQKKYGLAMGEETRPALPFFAAGFHGQTLDLPFRKNGYAQLGLLRHLFGVMPVACNQGCAETIFKAGRAAMLLAGDDKLDELSSAVGAEHLGIMPLPKTDLGPSKTARQSVYMGLGALRSQGEQAMGQALLDYLLSIPGQNALFNIIRAVPSMALANDWNLEQPIANTMREYLKSSSIAFNPADYNSLVELLDQSLPAYFAGSISESQAVSRVDSPLPREL